MVGSHTDLLNDYEQTVTTEVCEELGVEQAFPTSVSGQVMKAALAKRSVQVLDPKGPLMAEFHRGEKAVLSLALEHQGLIPLIDEQKAYQWGVKRELAVMSVPLWLASRVLSRPEDIPITMAKIKTLVLGRHLSMLLAHEAMVLLAARARATGES